MRSASHHTPLPYLIITQIGLAAQAAPRRIAAFSPPALTPAPSAQAEGHS